MRSNELTTSKKSHKRKNEELDYINIPIPMAHPLRFKL